MVRIDETLNALVCDICRVTQELRGRNAEQHVIAADSFRRRHRCRISRAKTPAATDRWQELFSRIKF